MSPFVNPALLWGLLILAVPILIHLINLVRHRRVQWAAMEFLLASRRKNSAWIKLKELLLLLLRSGGPGGRGVDPRAAGARSRVGALFGEVKTHQVVLLDDSFSMSDRWASTSAFEEAKRLVRRWPRRRRGSRRRKLSRYCATVAPAAVQARHSISYKSA